MTGEEHFMRFGAAVTGNGVRFALWAPTAETVSLIVDGARHEMTPDADGWHERTLADARPGSRYAYRIGDVEVPDPASRFQPEDVFAPSMVVDPAAYRWRDGQWRGRPWEETVLYEVHVGTFTPQGTYAALAERLPELAELGITAIELMPIADFVGTRNWGYDGVLPFAPDHAYGTPDDLKALVDRAHELGLMVFLDVVYNHFGPAGNYLSLYASTFFTERHQTPWGAGINFDGREGGPIVREFFLANALYWLEEYHFDGLRFDAVHAIMDDGDRHFLAEIAETIRRRTAGRHVHLVLENEANQARWLERDGAGGPLLHTAQWQDDLHNAWHVALTGEAEGYYADYADRPVERLARALAEGFCYQGEPTAREGHTRGEPSSHLPPTAFVAFLQNHDQIGNRAVGERLHDLAAPEALRLARAALLLGPQIPLMFMGEEWAAKTPFQFFVDFSNDPDLSRAVREGRRKEFAHFESFRGNEEAVPDPTARSTFDASTLDWAERSEPGHAAVLEEVAHLLAIRRREIVSLIGGRFLGASHALIGERGVDVEWRFEAGTLRFIANLGGEGVRVPDIRGKPLWSSANGAFEAGSDIAAWQGLIIKTGIEGVK